MEKEWRELKGKRREVIGEGSGNLWAKEKQELMEEGRQNWWDKGDSN